MYRIALCDDEEKEMNKTKEILDGYGIKRSEACLEVVFFDNADKLLARIRDYQYTPDLIVMDIYMPKKMGIDAAKELRAMGSSCNIIFLTTSKEHALDAFGVEATQYLVKPLSEEVLFPILDRLIEENKEVRKKYLLFRIGNSIRRVEVNDIVYCEAQGKIQCLHFTDGSQCELRITMSEIYERLSQYQEFVRAGISYIVNLEHIESMSRQEMRMDNGKVIFLPRGSFQLLRERYFGFYCEDDF